MFIKSINPKNIPININNVERALCVETKKGTYIIKFEMVSGGHLIWEYEIRAQRNEEFNKILGNTLNEG